MGVRESASLGTSSMLFGGSYSSERLVKLAEGYLEETHRVVESFECDGSPIYEGHWFADQEFTHCA